MYVRAVRLIGITHKLLGSSSATASAKTLSIKTIQGINLLLYLVASYFHVVKNKI